MLYLQLTVRAHLSLALLLLTAACGLVPQGWVYGGMVRPSAAYA
jgi:hypothetical protein